MPFNTHGVRTYALGLAHRAVRDIRRDNLRQLRRYVDLCALLSKRKGHRFFFDHAQEILAKADSLYYPLIQKVFNTVDEEHLCIFGVNFGIDAMTLGAAQLQQLNQAGEGPLPWLTLADAGQADELNTAVAADCAKGMYLWGFFARNEQQALQVGALAARHPTCDFMLVATPGCMTRTLVRYLQDSPNLATLVQLDSPQLTDEACAALNSLQAAKVNYGITLTLTDDTAPQVLQQEWLSLMAQYTPYCFFSHAQMSDAAVQQMTRQVYTARSTTGAPLLLIMWEEDCAYITRHISPNACIQDLRAR